MGVDTGSGRRTRDEQARRQLLALGAELRQAREGRFTLKDLAARAGVSMGLISQIERGMANPSFVTLSRLAYALDLPVSSLLGTAPQNDGALVRRDRRQSLALEHEGLVFELLTPDVERKLGLTLVSIPPGWANEQRPFQHEAEEAIHLLSGELVVHVGDDSYDLEPGDTVTFDAAKAHWMQNLGSAAAVALTAMTPPTF